MRQFLTRFLSRSVVSAFGWLAVATLATTGMSWAQGLQTGSLQGTVRGADGTALPGVSVRLTSEALLGSRTVRTASIGHYSVPALPPGTYVVRFELEGMEAREEETLVELGRSAQLDVQLEVSGLSETVDVIADAPAAVDSIEISSTRSAEVVDLLPIDRNPDAIADLAPGAAPAGPFPNSLSISGGVGYDNLVMLDGVDIVFSIFGTASGPYSSESALFIEEAIADTQVLTGGISAEYGRFSGGVVNVVTKTGSNRYAGSLRADLSNPEWRDEVPGEPDREGSTNEVFSGTLGGPISRDRLWFFGSAATTDRSEPIFLPLANAVGQNALDNRRFELKFNARLTDAQSVEALVHDNRSEVEGAQEAILGLLADPRALDQFTLDHRAIKLLYDAVPTNNLFVEARFADREFEPDGIGVGSRDIRDSPMFSVSGIINAPFFDETDPQNFETRQVSGSATWFLASEGAGSHELKAGFERYSDNRFTGNSQSSTDYFFDGNDFVRDQNGLAVLDAQGRFQPIFAPGETFLIGNVVDRDASLDLDTLGVFVNDRWRLNDRWTFNLGLRYEDMKAVASDVGEVSASDVVLPRLQASYAGGSRSQWRLSGGFAQYSGRSNQQLFKATSRAANPAFLILLYVGMPGAGIDFDPGFDLDNYFLLAVEEPRIGVSYADNVSTPVADEFHLSAGYAFMGGGWLEASLIDRELNDAIDSFVRIGNGTSLVPSPFGDFPIDNTVIDNADNAQRKYTAVEVQGHWPILSSWSVAGNWTWQLENDGNFEGSSRFDPAVFAGRNARPELQVERNVRDRPLNGYREHSLRLWTVYQVALGPVGNLELGLLGRYDSGTTRNLTARAPLSAQQLARDPGYAATPFAQTLFFDENGEQSFSSTTSVDLSARVSFAALGGVTPWLRFEVRNVFNDQSVLEFNTPIAADFAGPLDGDGLPTQFVRLPGYGQVNSIADYQTPREWRLALGLRF